MGTTGGTAGDRGLAMVRINRLGDALAAGETLRAGDRAVALERPSYAGFAMPEAAGAPAAVDPHASHYAKSAGAGRRIAARKVGLTAAVSPRALNSGGPVSSFFQVGNSPHRAASIRASFPAILIRGTCCVGAML